MPAQYTRADSLREYLTGASSDGGIQSSPSLSLGNYRSLTEAVTLGIVITSPITNVAVLYAGGGNPVGSGQLNVVDSTHLVWKPFGASTYGPSCSFSGTDDVEIVESASSPGEYLRVRGTTPFPAGTATVTLSRLYNNFFGFDDVSSSDAGAGIIQYRASIIRNESASAITALQRCVSLLGVSQVSNITRLGSSGAGTITTTGSFNTWPAAGWAQVRQAGGSLREIVYYTSRSSTVLTVPTNGRGLLGTSAAAGAVDDVIYPTTGIVLALNPTGVTAFGSAIQTIASQTTAPSSVTWNAGITLPTGLQIGTLNAGQQVGVWMKRQIPAGCKATPASVCQVQDAFNAS